MRSLVGFCGTLPARCCFVTARRLADSKDVEMTVSLNEFGHLMSRLLILSYRRYEQLWNSDREASQVSHPIPSPSPSKWWGSGGSTRKFRYGMSAQSKSGGG